MPARYLFSHVSRQKEAGLNTTAAISVPAPPFFTTSMPSAWHVENNVYGVFGGSATAVWSSTVFGEPVNPAPCCVA